MTAYETDPAKLAIYTADDWEALLSALERAPVPRKIVRLPEGGLTAFAPVGAPKDRGGRPKKGEVRAPKVKAMRVTLTDPEAIKARKHAILEACRTGGATLQQIADHFGVSLSTVSLIRAGKR